MTSKLKLKVNGSTQDVNVEANTMLLYVLRDAMELHRPKFGCSLVISPDGLHNQIEGNIIQSLSCTLHEEVTFDHSRVTSLEWTAYPILHFSEIPDDIEMVLVNNDPEHKSTGGGEPSTNPTGRCHQQRRL